MHLSRLTTAVALATALSVPAFTAPAHAATTTYSVLVGFNPNSGPAPTVDITNTTPTPVAFKASWQPVPQVAFAGGTVTFTGGSRGDTVTALGSGALNPIYTLT